MTVLLDDVSRTNLLSTNVTIDNRVRNERQIRPTHIFRVRITRASTTSPPSDTIVLFPLNSVGSLVFLSNRCSIGHSFPWWRG